MAIGDIGASVLGSLAVTDLGIVPSIVHLSGDYIAVTGYDTAGAWVKTYSITDDGATITLINSWEFDTVDGASTLDIIKIPGSTDKYLLAHYEASPNFGKLSTLTISTTGVITESFIDTLDAVNFGTYQQSTHTENANDICFTVDYSGIVDSYTVDSDGNIGASVIDTEDYATAGAPSNIVHIDGNYYAFAHKDSIHTFSTDGSGNITAVASWDFSATTDWAGVSLIKVPSSTKYIVAYRDSADGGKGKLGSVNITDVGVITNSFTDTLTFDNVVSSPQLIHIGNDYFVVTYVDDDNGADKAGASVAAFTCSSAGAISNTVTDFLALIVGVDTDNECNNLLGGATRVSGDIYVAALPYGTNTAKDGYLKTFSIETPVGLVTETSTIQSDSNVCAVESSTIQSNSNVIVTESSTINSDSHIYVTESDTINSNSHIKATESSTIDSDSYIKAIESSTIQSDSYVTETESSTIQSDSHIKAVESDTIQSDSHIYTIDTSTIQSDSHIKATESTTIALDSHIKATESSTIQSNSHIYVTETSTIDSNSHVIYRETSTINSNSHVTVTESDTIQSNATYIRVTESSTINSDSHIAVTESDAIDSDSHVKATESSTIQSDSHVIYRETDTIQSDSYIYVTESDTIQSDSHITVTESDTIASDSHVVYRETSTIQFDSCVVGTESDTIQSDSHVAGVVTESSTIQSDSHIYVEESTTPSPYVYYHFNESSGTNVADSSGYGRHGTLQNADGDEWVAGKLNNCLYFNYDDPVRNDWVDCGDIASFSKDTAFSIEFWVFPVVNPYAGGRIIHKGGDGDAEYVLRQSSDKYYSWELRANNNVPIYVNSSTVTFGEWHHIVCTYDGSGTKEGLDIYIDGITSVDLRSGEPFVVDMTLSGPLSIVSDAFIVKLDEFVIYEKELTVNDVLYRYNEGIGRAAGTWVTSDSYVVYRETNTIQSASRVITKAVIEDRYKVPRRIRPNMRNTDTMSQSGGRRRTGGFRIF